MTRTDRQHEAALLARDQGYLDPTEELDLADLYHEPEPEDENDR